MGQLKTNYLWDDDWEDNIFESAKEKYGVWPLTVWPCNHQDTTYKELKKRIGDFGNGRQECFTRKTNDKSVYRGKHTESIFNPQVGIWIMNCFAPKNGICFDPFAGGGTRAIIAAKHGLNYVGIELREEESNRIKDICMANKVNNLVKIIMGDAKDCIGLIGSKNYADFLITCPPYWNLEKYNGGENDLSMLSSYDEFLESLYIVIRGCFAVMKPGTLSCWVVGLHRNDAGELLALNHDISKLHKKVGFSLREEIIIEHQGTGAIRRIGNFEKGNKWLIRTHEYVLVFEK